MESLPQSSDVGDIESAPPRKVTRDEAVADLRKIVDKITPPLGESTTAVAASRSHPIALIPVSELVEHGVAKDVPSVSTDQFTEMLNYAMERGVPGERNLVVLPDQKTVIFGFHELRVAREAKLATVACVIVDEADPRAYALRNTMLLPQLTKDQLSVVAWKLKEHLSMTYKTARARKAVAAKGVMPNLSVQRTDKLAAKKDARKEISVERKVSERALKNIDAIVKYEKENKPKDGSALDKIMAGKTSIAAAKKKIDTVIESVAVKVEEKRLADLPSVEDWLFGDPINVFREHVGDRKVGLLLLEHPEPKSLKRVLDVALPTLEAQATVVCIVSFQAEGAIQKELGASGLRVSRPLILDVSKSLKGKLGERHLSVLVGTKAVAPPLRADVPPSDVLVEPSVNGRAVTLHTVFSLFSRANDLIVEPFAPDPSGFLAAKNSNRSVLAVATTESEWKEGKSRIYEVNAATVAKNGGAR